MQPKPTLKQLREKIEERQRLDAEAVVVQANDERVQAEKAEAESRMAAASQAASRAHEERQRASARHGQQTPRVPLWWLGLWPQVVVGVAVQVATYLILRHL